MDSCQEGRWVGILVLFCNVYVSLTPGHSGKLIYRRNNSTFTLGEGFKGDGKVKGL